MGKRKIGEIYNKPIVEGDLNLKTSNEIHKNDLLNKTCYYSIDSMADRVNDMKGCITQIKYTNSDSPNTTFIESPAYFNYGCTPIAVSIDHDLLVTHNKKLMTVKEVIEKYYGNVPTRVWTRITKEEFYSL